MPQIPALPVDEPVEKPHASPAQFGSVGNAIADLGAETEQLAAGASEVEGHLIRANRDLKATQAEIAVERIKKQTYLDLQKATTPEKAQAIYEHSKGQIGDALTPFESDRNLARSLGIFQQQTDVEMQATTNASKADIISKGAKLSIETLGVSAVQDAINTKAGGGDPQIPLTAFGAKIQAFVDNKVLWPQEAEAIMRNANKEFEAGYIEAQINGTDLQAIQNTVNDIRLHPGNYPHLTKAELEQLANKGENAIVTRMSLNDEINAKSEQAKYWNQSPTGIPKLFTDATGNFDQMKAESYVASLGLSPEGEKLLMGDIKTHSAAANGALEQQAAKAQNSIVEDGNNHNWKSAAAKLEQYKQFADQHPDFAESFKSMSNYIDEKKSREMSLGIESFKVREEAYTINRQQQQDDSYATLGKLGPRIAAKEFTDAQLYSMTGGGTGPLRPGQMLPQQVEEAIKLNHSEETDPSIRKYSNSIWNDTALPPEVQARAVTEFQEWVRKNPNVSEDAKAAEVKHLLDPAYVQEIGKRLDDLNEKYNNPQGQQKPTKHWWQADDEQEETPKQQQPKPRPKIGDVIDGFEYEGGDPNDRSSWKEADQ